MKGLWWRGKRGRTWEREWRFMSGWTAEKLLAVRRLMPHPKERDQIGFAPRTAAVVAAERNGVLLPNGADGIAFSYALYQRVQVCDGTWEDGPPSKGDSVWLCIEDGTARRARLG